MNRTASRRRPSARPVIAQRPITPAEAAKDALVRATGIHRLYVKYDEAALAAAGTDFEAVAAVFAAAYPQYASQADRAASAYLAALAR